MPRFETRCTDKEKAAWEAAAAASDHKLSEWARRKLNDAAASEQVARALSGTRETARRRRPPCPRASRHRKGVFCKSCSRTP